MFQYLVPELDIQLFAEGAAAGNAAGAGAPAGSEVAAPNTEKSSPSSTENKKGAKPDLSKVLYGKQDEAAREAPTATEAPKESAETQASDKKAVFEELIKGEYKDVFSARVDDIVRDRLKGSKSKVESYDALTPTLSMLYEKYGVKEGDIKALNKAIADDDAFYEAEAMERGVSVEQLKEFKKTQRENAEMRRMMDEQKARGEAERRYAGWMQQAEAAKSVYNGLDLRAELQNPAFARLLQSGVDVKTAFEVIHKDEIIPAAMQYTAKKVEEQMANKIKSNASRPNENGTSSRSASNVKSDVNSFSKEDFDEIIRRVQRGEKIRL